MEEIFAGGGYNVLLNFVELIHFYARGALIHSSKDFLVGKKLVEFGVCNGGSLRSFIDIYDQWRLPIDFWGFDSFEGIPVERLDKIISGR